MAVLPTILVALNLKNKKCRLDTLQPLFIYLRTIINYYPDVSPSPESRWRFPSGVQELVDV